MLNKYFIQHNSLVAILFVSIGWLGSCQKSVDVFVPDPGQNGADTNWVSGITSLMPVSVLKDSILLQPQTDSIFTQSPDTIKVAGSLKCIFPGNCLRSPDSLPVAGKVKIEIMLVQKKGDLIRMNKPTIADGRVLETAGSVFIKITREGIQLELRPAISAVFEIPHQVPSPAYKMFSGGEIGEKYNWEKTDSATTVRPVDNAYRITARQLDWLSVANFVEAASYSRVQLSLPVQYTNANTAAYLILNNKLSVINIDGNATEKKFICENIPADNAATVVVISRQGNDYFTGTESLTVTQGTNFVNLLPVKMSLASLKQLLDAL